MSENIKIDDLSSQKSKILKPRPYDKRDWFQVTIIVLDFCIALYTWCWILFFITILEYGNNVFRISNPINHSKNIQDFSVKIFNSILCFLIEKSVRYTWIGILVRIIEIIKDLFEVINKGIIELEKNEHLTEGGGWIGIIHWILLIYHSYYVIFG